jgi:hypothetical protein
MSKGKRSPRVGKNLEVANENLYRSQRILNRTALSKWNPLYYIRAFLLGGD